MSCEPTRHGSSDGWRQGLIVALDAAGDIIGGIALLALPLAVLTPGLIALLGLSIPLLLPLVALALVLGILGAPLAGVWMLVKVIRRTR